MSASGVLQKFVKRGVISHESRRALDEFLRSPCYNYFSKTLQGPDILGYADFLDKASAEFIQSVLGLICTQGTELDSNDGEALDKLFECAPTDMLGQNRTAHHTRVGSRIGQKRKCFHHCPRH